MPHYKNGREAKLGDKCVIKGWDGTVQTVVLCAIQPQEAACNATGHPVSMNVVTVELSKALHVDDAEIAEKLTSRLAER